MAKRKPPQPNLSLLPPANYRGQAEQPPPPPNGQPNGNENFSNNSAEHAWSDAEATSESYRRLDDKLRDFVYAISRGYSVRHACRMSGENYERMLDYLSAAGPLCKPDLLRLVDKARAVAYARQIEKLN